MDAPEDVKKVGRIDGKGMRRETMFTDPTKGQSAGNWLSEADVDFFTGGMLSSAIGQPSLMLNKKKSDFL